jgi:hypothetical protein
MSAVLDGSAASTAISVLRSPSRLVREHRVISPAKGLAPQEAGSSVHSSDQAAAGAGSGSRKLSRTTAGRPVQVGSDLVWLRGDDGSAGVHRDPDGVCGTEPQSGVRHRPDDRRCVARSVAHVGDGYDWVCPQGAEPVVLGVVENAVSLEQADHGYRHRCANVGGVRDQLTNGFDTGCVGEQGSRVEDRGRRDYAATCPCGALICAAMSCGVRPVRAAMRSTAAW